MDVLGQRLSIKNALHLVETKTVNTGTLQTLCGRKIRSAYALPQEKFDFGSGCCAICRQMQRRSA